MRNTASTMALVASLGATVAALPAQAQQQQQDQGSYNWSGLYGGGNLGGSFGGSDFLSSLGSGVPFFEGALYPGALPDTVATVARQQAAFESNKGKFGTVTGGIQGGYNFRSGNWVYGLEADLNFLRAKSSSNTSAPGAVFARVGASTYTFSSELSANYLATLRPRAGMLINGNLLYATGGLAVTTLNYKHDFRGTGGGFTGGPDITEHASESKTKAGWTLGAGLEMPLSQFTTLRAEYSFARFGKIASDDNKINPVNVTAPAFDTACGALTNPGLGNLAPYPVPNPTPRQCFNHAADLLLHNIKIGVNFKF
jgi:outer membrane immunogenic protein